MHESQYNHTCVSSRTDPDDDVVDVTSFEALDVVERKNNNHACVLQLLQTDAKL